MSREDGASTKYSPIVGFALLPSKAKKHLGPKLIAAAAASGIDIKYIDSEKPLTDQEPFDVLIHKIRTPEWDLELLAYKRDHPALLVVDSVPNIRNLVSRATMLDVLDNGGITLTRKGDARPASGGAPQTIRVCAPVQASIEEGMLPEQALVKLKELGIQPPLLAKPMYANGEAEGHRMALIHDLPGVEQMVGARGLSGFAPPLMLQPYVDHGGCLFKVFVMGPITVMARRPSLRIPVDPEDVTEEVGSAQSIARVSAFDSETPRDSVEPGDPPQWMLESLAQELRRRLNLNLFNFDLICPTWDRAGERPCGVPEGADYLIIDINYFPGFEKLPNYESMVVSFLHWLLGQGSSEKEREPVPGSPGDSSAQRLLPKFVSFSQTPSGRLPRQGSASSTGSVQAPPLLPSTPLVAHT